MTPAEAPPLGKMLVMWRAYLFIFGAVAFGQDVPGGQKAVLVAPCEFSSEKVGLQVLPAVESDVPAGSASQLRLTNAEARKLAHGFIG